MGNSCNPLREYQCEIITINPKKSLQRYNTSSSYSRSSSCSLKRKESTKKSQKNTDKTIYYNYFTKKSIEDILEYFFEHIIHNDIEDHHLTYILLINSKKFITVTVSDYDITLFTEIIEYNPLYNIPKKCQFYTPVIWNLVTKEQMFIKKNESQLFYYFTIA